jgi:hypothetical protein
MLQVMYKVSVAFSVLSALFWVYVVAATWRSRGAGSHASRDRRVRHKLVGGRPNIHLCGQKNDVGKSGARKTGT